MNHPTQDYLIGAQLDEYRLESLLGRGGMARVYRALDVNLNRPAAVKVIDIPHRTEEEYSLRFKREAQAIARLDHPHIVRLYRFGEVNTGMVGGSILYMAMQFIKGADLQYLLDSYRKDGELIETGEAYRIIREVCEALDYAHANGVIHRDIKPSNIMLDWQGRAIVADFGLALISTQATRGEVFGSPDYIAPEQVLSSAKAVPQSDLYAVGTIAYEMFTGVLPFSAGEPLELAMMHVNNPVPSPRKFRPEISPEMEAVLLKALAKRPEDRYPTGQALSDAVQNALSGKSLALPPGRMTIPQRITLGLADPASPGGHLGSDTPPTRKSVVPNLLLGEKAQEQAESLPQVETSAQPNSPAQDPHAEPSGGRVPSAAPAAASPPQGQPKDRKQNNRTWLYAGLGGLLVLLMCLGGSSLILVNQILARATRDPAATLTPPKGPTAHFANTFPTAPIEPIQTVSSTPVPYQLQVIRQEEDKGYLILLNTGTIDLPIEAMSLRTGKDRMDGLTWSVRQLAPGACLVARKEGYKQDGLPNGAACSPTGPTLILGKSQDAIFKDKLDVYYGDKLLGTCEREYSMCPFAFSD